MEANCVFVNLEHRLYLPDPVIPDMFRPRPLTTPTPTPSLPAAWSQLHSIMEGPSWIPDPRDKGKGRAVVYMEDLLAPGCRY